MTHSLMSRSSVCTVSFKRHLNMLVAQSCLTLCNPMNCNPPGFSVLGFFQARILEWVAMPSFRGSSQPRDQTPVLLHCSQILYHLSHQGSPRVNFYLIFEKGCDRNKYSLKFGKNPHISLGGLHSKYSHAVCNLMEYIYKLYIKIPLDKLNNLS